jgi:hypothetical protein
VHVVISVLEVTQGSFKQQPFTTLSLVTTVVHSTIVRILHSAGNSGAQLVFQFLYSLERKVHRLLLYIPLETPMYDLDIM